MFSRMWSSYQVWNCPSGSEAGGLLNTRKRFSDISAPLIAPASGRVVVGDVCAQVSKTRCEDLARKEALPVFVLGFRTVEARRPFDEGLVSVRNRRHAHRRFVIPDGEIYPDEVVGVG